jgi:glycosyltransferase involved in cell wall biosynthesis
VPTVDEVVSLEKTCEILIQKVPAQDLASILIIVGKPTTDATRRKAQELANKYNVIQIIEQELPYLGGALQTGIKHVNSSHLVIMGSDLETNPEDIDQLINKAKLHPDYIIATSRWINGRRIRGYNPIKLVCNWLFQQLMVLMFKAQLTDWTFGYRVMPSRLVQSIQWNENRHAFNLECLLVPLQQGCKVLEIPTSWVPRSEGSSQNSFFLNFIYFRTAIKIWASKNS